MAFQPYNPDYSLVYNGSADMLQAYDPRFDTFAFRGLPTAYLSEAMPIVYGYPFLYNQNLVYNTVPIFSLNQGYNEHWPGYPIIPMTQMGFSRPVLQAAAPLELRKRKMPQRKDVLACLLAARTHRLSTKDLPADRTIGPMNPEWTDRLQTHDAADSIEDLTDEEDSKPRPKRQRTTAEVKKRMRDKQTFNSDGTITVQKQNKIHKFVEKQVTDAKVNYAIFQDFNFTQNLKPRSNPIPPQATSWDDGIPRSAKSADNIDLVFYIPRMFTDDWTYGITDYLINVGRHKSPPHFYFKAGEATSYIERPGELAGGLTCVRGWNTIASDKISEKYNCAEEMVQTAETHQNSKDLLLKLGIVSHHVNSFLYHADRTHYQDAKALRTATIHNLGSPNTMCNIDPLVYEGREILFNQVSGDHIDIQDPPNSWAVLTAFGNNTPVVLSIPQLNLHISFEPGDTIAIRRRVLKHSTSSWEQGQRIVIPHFTHTASL